MIACRYGKSLSSRVEHSKRYSVSTRAYALSSIYFWVFKNHIFECSVLIPARVQDVSLGIGRLPRLGAGLPTSSVDF